MKIFLVFVSLKKQKETPFQAGMLTVKKLGWKKKARNQYARNPTISNKIEMNRATAVLKKTILQETREGWKKLIEEKFSNNTTIKDM